MIKPLTRTLALALLAGAAATQAISACGPIGSNGSSGGGESSPPGGGGPDGGGVRDGGGISPPNSDAGPTPTPPPGGGTTDQFAPGGYLVEGPTIYTSDRKPHVFHGIDRPSLEWNRAGEQLSVEDYKLMASWKANVVRISLNQGFWLSGSSVFSSAYANVVDQNVRWAHEAGMDVILDLHWSDRGDYSTTPAQQMMADAHSVLFWTEVATRYKNDGRILFELYNEPHDVSWEVWRNGGQASAGFTAVGMQKLYDTVRGTGAQNLVLIGGLNYAFDLSGIRNYRVSGYNIVYVTHPYDTSTKQRVTWDNSFGYLAATDPVMATEFGNLRDCGTSYYSQFLEYANQKRISWSGWAWYVKDCTFPSLISDWSGTPTASGQIIKATLASY
jgi:endoglucanase